MPGQIKKRGDGRWQARIWQGRDPVTGKRRSISKTIRGTKKDAERWITTTLHALDTHSFVEPNRRSVNEYLTEWLDSSVKVRVRERTFYDYKKLIERYIAPKLGFIKLSQLTPLHIQSLYATMQENGLSARTVRYTHSVLRSALEQAVKWNFLVHNPATRVAQPQQTRREMSALTVDETNRFLESAKPDRWYPLWLLLVTTGLRPSEALGLKWPDIDFENGRIHIQRALAPSAKGAWVFAEPKTRRSRRVVTLPTTTTRALQIHKVRQNTEILNAGHEYKRNELVFASRTGGPLEMRNLVRRHFNQILKQSNVPRIRLYDLRHTCATMLLSFGINPKVVSERLGHSSIILTLDTYSHVLPDMQANAAEQIEAMLTVGKV